MFQTLALAAMLVGTETKADSYPRANLLIEPADWVKKPAAAQSFRILDARPQAKYRAGHVPDAVWVDHDKWNKTFRDDQSAETWNKLVGGLGIDIGTPVVVYDDNGTNAARVWWILRYWGVKDARLLNGGWTAWKAAGGEIDKS
ncbi:MAG TPA: rhodanese-like domain-containing protein, partial [Gemmataceae bacterium]|nr:rhodanese-like domain-containing protein [Gemmataceae bacterium]